MHCLKVRLYAYDVKDLFGTNHNLSSHITHILLVLLIGINNFFLSNFVAILTDSVTKHFYNIEDLGTADNYNLLFVSVLNSCYEDVKRLCAYNFKIDQKFKVKNQNGQTKKFSAIDMAWNNSIDPRFIGNKYANNKIILCLLNANSKLPKGFNKAKASSEVQSFVENAEKLHDFVDAKNLSSLKEEIDKYPDLWYFYDQNNQSLMARTLKAANLDIFKLLSSLKLSIGPHEIIDHEKLYKNLKDDDKEAIRDHNLSNAKDILAAHIHTLFSKCKIANYNRNHHIYQWKILEALRIIDSGYGYPKSSKSKDGRSKVLKVVAAFKKVKIIFDFDHDSNYYFDPLTSIERRGTVYKSGVIEIGAKDLMNEQEKFGVIGTLIHELCHLAVSLTYKNGFNPYQVGDSDEKKRFMEKVRPECENNKRLEEIIELVFDNNVEDKINYELIVRPYHMMMKYFKENDKIDECRENFKELFDYLEDVVEKEFDKFLTVWVKLNDDEQNIKFYQLTEPMKAKILHEKVYFQNAKTSLFTIFGNNENILNVMTSLNIRNILFDKRYFSFGEICEITSKYDFIERKFTAHKYRDNVQVSQTFYLDFKTIKKHVNDSKLFILTGKAGEGKSTIFEKYCNRLKNDYILKNYWISCLKLKKNQKTLTEFSKLNYDNNIDKIPEIIFSISFKKALVKNFNFNANFEFRVFKELFENGKSILFFDGIDEISPELNEFILNVLQTIKQYSKNQIWISTRPHYEVQIRRALNADLFTLEPYNYRDRKNMIKNIARELKIESCIPSLLNIFTETFQFIYNPFLIEIIIELYEDNETLIHTNIGQMLENIISTQYAKMDSKIEPKDKFDLSKFYFLYQVLALKYLFNESEIEHLSIIEKWELGKENLTIDVIQRYGYVTVYQEFLETGNKDYIDFTHFIYAEYFAASYIYENIFDKSKNDKELEYIFSMLSTDCMIYSSILPSFFRKNIEIKNLKLPDRIKQLMKCKIEEILKMPAKQNLDKLKYWTTFLRNEHEILEELRDKKVEISKSEIIAKVSEYYKDEKTLNLLRAIINEWGENFNENLKEYLRKLGGEVRSVKESSKLVPNFKWFNDYKEKMFLLTLVNNLKIYLEKIFDKYSKNHSLKVLCENYGFPSISLFMISDEESIIKLLTKSPQGYKMFNSVIKEFLKKEAKDQDYKNYKQIVIDLKPTIDRESYIDKLLEEEFFENTIKDYCLRKSCNDALLTIKNIFSNFLLYIKNFLPFNFNKITANSDFVSKKPKSIRRNICQTRYKTKNKNNWKRKM